MIHDKACFSFCLYNDTSIGGTHPRIRCRITSRSLYKPAAGNTLQAAAFDLFCHLRMVLDVVNRSLISVLVYFLVFVETEFVVFA